jgi:hypothetical protein
MNKNTVDTTAITIDSAIFNNGSNSKNSSLTSAKINPIVDKTELDLVAGFGSKTWGQAHGQAWAAWSANF